MYYTKADCKQLALACKTSQEFAERAVKTFGKERLSLAFSSDADLREFYRQTTQEYQEEVAWKKYDTIDTLLKQRADCAKLWYETWIDLRQTWLDKWFASFRFMTDAEIVEVCAKYLNERERFYDSHDYIDMLNSMLSKAK